MKKGIICVSLLSISLVNSFDYSKNNISYIHQDNVNEVKNVDRVNYTIQEFCDYLQDKKEHYPLSDEFIERYQQSSGGYIDYAKKCGIEVNKYNHSPNQKWHFFSSWIDQSLNDGSLTMSDDAYQRIYIGLKCPELLLWIYEAMGTDIVKVRKAKEVAETGKVNNTNVSTIAKNMRGEVSWEDLTINMGK